MFNYSRLTRKQETLCNEKRRAFTPTILMFKYIYIQNCKHIMKTIYEL